MEPIPETTEAVEEFGPFTDDLLQSLRERAERVRTIVPDCVGLSLASIEDGVTFTLVATDVEVALLDSLQYVSGGPCVVAVETEEALEYRREDPLDEEQWRLFARGTAAAAVASTLSLPIVVDDAVVGSVNLYAASAHAFTGYHEEIAGIFDAWAPGAVSNADLSFSTRATAEQAPNKLRGDYNIEVAIGLIATLGGVSADSARTQLRMAAQRAGVSQAQLADTLITLDRMRDE